MLRSHRRRFVRKFQIIEDMVDEEEIEKFETGPDGALIKVKRENAITPIANADLGSAESLAIQTSSDDMDRISGTSQEERGVADRTTATQANIVNQRSGIRENKERDRFVLWMATFGREALLLSKEKLALGIWVKLTSPEGEHIFGSVQTNAPAYKWVTSEDIEDGYDFRINVDITSMSTTAQDDEKQKFLQFLSVSAQFPQIALSPTLVREAAYRCGYRNEKVIKELQQMALLHQLGLMNQLKASLAQQQEAMQPQGGPQGGNAPQQLMAQMQPPDVEQMRNQLQGQLLQGQ
jgi:hypothetical protein